MSLILINKDIRFQGKDMVFSIGQGHFDWFDLLEGVQDGYKTVITSVLKITGHSWILILPKELTLIIYRIENSKKRGTK